MFKRIPRVIICAAFIFKLVGNSQPENKEEYADSKQEQVVIRAVFIDCDPEEQQNFLGKEVPRFQREELFKHSALQGCRKKLALTVKITSEPDKNSGDEYIPIEHVFDGSNQKRARLLDPYILRIRREPLLQAYKLRRIETVSGILTEFAERDSIKSKKNRVQRDLNEMEKREELGLEASPEVIQGSSYTIGNKEHYNITTNLHECGIGHTRNLTKSVSSLEPIKIDQDTVDSPVFLKLHANYNSIINQHGDMKEESRVKRDVCTLANNPVWKRERRHEHNIIVEDITDDYKMPMTGNDRYYRRFNHVAESAESKVFEDNKSITSSKDDDEKLEGNDKIAVLMKGAQKKFRESNLGRDSFRETDKEQRNDDLKNNNNFIVGEHSAVRSVDKNYHQKNKYEDTEKKFELYDIGNGDVWYSAHIQLFEKMSTPEGKTAWNDITKGEVASVSTMQPEWTDQDLNVRYKPSDWTSRDGFTLPSTTNLCLLAPKHDSFRHRDDILDTLGKYIVVPKEDIVGLEDTKNMLVKRDKNKTDFTTTSDSIRDEQGHRRVLVRVSRALLTESDVALKLVSIGTDQFLTLPHQLPHHAQIDLEARADDNQLIRVGSSGSIINVVADNSRLTRCIITVHATNKGLAAAKFRVKARDCGPEMANVLGEKSEGLIAGPILLPPRHTQKFIMKLPTQNNGETIHCSVALINEDEESVAVRDVLIKRGDRCFCVWHCDCVCLNHDPKLLCHEMAQARQAAAGLSPRESTRRARSACYPDNVSVNLFVTVIGVLMTLLLIGALKACLGLFFRCVGKWGLDRLIRLPRKLEHYYESGLQGRAVVYDGEGWPVHPDTQKRNVRFISKSMEFLLNLIFFIVLPCALIRDAIVQLASRSKQCSGDTMTVENDDKKICGTQDIQNLQLRGRRRRGQRRWMTPQAEELSTDIWRKGISPGKYIKCEFMRPLLHERRVTVGNAPSSCVESDQEDTEYVLMQMQKSKESLARTQKNIFEPGPSSTSKLNTEAKVSHSIIR